MFRLSKILAYSILFFVAAVSSCSSVDQKKVVEGRVVPVDKDQMAEIDMAVDAVIETYRSSLSAEMSQVLAHSAQTMRKGTPEDLLNNFVADLVLEKGQDRYLPDDGKAIDMCVLNYGGLRTSIPQGEITRSRIYELMPFDNEMVVLTISPEKTQELFEYIASRNVGVPLSGIQLGVKDRKVASVSIRGEPFDMSRPYKVLTSDYLASAGDNMSFFVDPLNTELIGMRIRDAIILHLEEQHKKGLMISSQLDGRIYYEE